MFHKILYKKRCTNDYTGQVLQTLSPVYMSPDCAAFPTASVSCKAIDTAFANERLSTHTVALLLVHYDIGHCFH